MGWQKMMEPTLSAIWSAQTSSKKNRVGSILEILPKLFCVKTSRCV
jgi:hypothetical protein